MLSKSWRPLVATLGYLLLGGSLAAAQPASGTPAPPPEKPPAAAVAEKPRADESAVPRIEESKPSVYYLPDKDGNLQPVLDFKYQDFEELYKLKNQLGRRDEPPRYSVERMTVTGSAAEEYAELSLQVQVLDPRRRLGAGAFASRPGIASRRGPFQGPRRAIRAL